MVAGDLEEDRGWAALRSSDGLEEAIGGQEGESLVFGVPSSSLLPARPLCGEVFPQRAGLTTADAAL